MTNNILYFEKYWWMIFFVDYWLHDSFSRARALLLFFYILFDCFNLTNEKSIWIETFEKNKLTFHVCWSNEVNDYFYLRTVLDQLQSRSRLKWIHHLLLFWKLMNEFNLKFQSRNTCAPVQGFLNSSMLLFMNRWVGRLQSRRQVTFLFGCIGLAMTIFDYWRAGPTKSANVNSLKWENLQLSLF